MDVILKAFFRLIGTIAGIILLLAFILPLIASNLLHHIYNAADIMVVELSTEPDAVGAVTSLTSQAWDYPHCTSA